MNLQPVCKQLVDVVEKVGPIWVARQQRALLPNAEMCAQPPARALRWPLEQAEAGLQEAAGYAASACGGVQSVRGSLLLTAAAMDHFAAAQVDLAVLEVGLGGRLDVVESRAACLGCVRSYASAAPAAPRAGRGVSPRGATWAPLGGGGGVRGVRAKNRLDSLRSSSVSIPTIAWSP